MRAPFFKKFYKAHVYIGIFVSLHFLILSLTGSLLIVEDQIQSGSRPHLSNLNTQNEKLSISYESILRNALSKFPVDRPLAIFPDESRPEMIHLRFGKEGSRHFRGARKLIYDGISGHEQGSEKSRNGFFAFVLILHRELFLGEVGKLYVGFVGCLFLLTLMSGLIIYGGFMKGRSFAEIRRQSSSQTFADFHKWIGVSVFGWAFLIGSTGVLLAFNGSLIKLYQYQELKYLKTKYSNSVSVNQTVSLDRVVSNALEAKPDFKLSYIAFPNTDFSIPDYFLVLIKGSGPRNNKVTELVLVDAASGKRIEILKLPVYLKLAMLSEPLHFGNYGGTLLRVMWLVFSLMSGGLAFSGLATFMIKKRRKAENSKSRFKKIKLIFSNHPLFRSQYSIPLILSCFTVSGVISALLNEGHLKWVPFVLVGSPLLFLLSIFGSFFKQERECE